MTRKPSKNNLAGAAALAAGLGAGLSLGWLGWQMYWMARKLRAIDPQRSLAEHANQGPPGLMEIEACETETFSLRHTIEDGIERVSYYPKRRAFQTPLLFQHGMWHGAWCWQPWQALFAAWGWESHAISLPGHAGSPEQRPIRLCTLDYYLGFLNAEIQRLARKPVLVGHSMGGALTQWYFRYAGDDLPAAVLLAPWVSHCAWIDGLPLFAKLDPLGCALISLDWSAAPFVRTPERAARMLLGPQAIVAPDELHAKLDPESALVMQQHNPPCWQPVGKLRTPTLWLAAELDAVVSVAGLRRSAAHYGGDFVVVPGAGHNVMMERENEAAARTIHEWLASLDIE